MNDLNKTQVLLLTLFVSFVTSIATGIVTVTLLEQAPVGVTQTINRVVEHTVERITPGESKTTIKEVLVSGEDLVAKAAQESKFALVRIKATFTAEEGDYEKTLTGVVIGSEGYIVSSRELQASSNTEVAVVLPSGTEVKAQIVAVGEGEASIVKLEKAAAKLTGLSLTNEDPELGDLMMALGYQGKNTALHLGRVIKVDDGDASSTPVFVTDLSSDWPLLLTNGRVAGFGKKDGKIVPAAELASLIKAAASGTKVVSSSHAGQAAELIQGVLGSAATSTIATSTPILTNP